MQLVSYTDADLALSEALETDPVVMRELGGPIDLAHLARVHPRRVNDPWYFTVVLEAGQPPVGTIGIWETEHDGVALHETGWMILPAFQGRGIASAALTLLIERARAAPEIPRIHAFPPTSNAPSNALCRKFAFTLLGEHAFVYAGRTLQCNHWMLGLSEAGGA
ncbi:MAG TPA: GNAT family protein [Solirubrobacteraceae bacterium]|nr:GNAT family protein [Solirubrobacteraceae bacterium]